MEKATVIVNGHSFLLDKEIYETYKNAMGDTDETEALNILSIIRMLTKCNTIEEALLIHSKKELEDLIIQRFTKEMKDLGIQ